MKFIRITDDLSLSKLALGTVSFGTGVDEATSFAIMDAYYARGGDTIDTAKVYGSWNPEGISLSEVTVGNWVKARGLRDRVKLITKGCHPILGRPGPRVNAACVHADIEESLLRLQTEVIDHWYLHRDDESIPVEEIIDALEAERRQGRIRSYGASNWSTERIAAANAYAATIGGQGFTSSQINWSLAQGNPEALQPQGLVAMTPESGAWYKAAGIPVLAWSSLGSGILTRALAGKLDTVAKGTMAQFWNPVTERRVETLRVLSAETGLTPLQLIVGYILCNPIPGAALVGPKSVEQLEGLMDCAEVELSASLIERLD